MKYWEKLTNLLNTKLYKHKEYSLFMNEKRAKFLRIYANLPDELREDILVVVDEKTYTWNSAFLAIKDNSDLGKKILKTLEVIGLL